MGATSTFADEGIDYSQAMSTWVAQAQYFANALAASPGGTSNIPVLAMPLMSTSDTSTTALQAFNQIASGADDSIWIGMVQAYVAAGFTTIYIRPGWEMNGNFMPWSVTNETEAAAYVAAFQHIATVVRGVSGINVQMVWDPADLTNTAIPTQDMYPGNNYVDVIGTDIYDTLYPKSLYDWSTGTVDATIQQWWANPVNVEHYWDYPDGTQYRPQGIGLGWGLVDAMNFAVANGKPFALPEVGAGGNGNTGPVDDAVFPEYLAQRLLANGAPSLAFVEIWERYGTMYEFTDGNHPAESAAWADFVKKIEQNDAGPSYNPAKIIVAHNQTTNLLATLQALIAPGRTGDTETISNVSAANGTVSIGPNGAINYTAGAAGTDTITFIVTDQLGDEIAVTQTVTIDPGPTIAATATTLGHGQTFTLAGLASSLVTPGIKGDVETFSHVTSANGQVTVSANGVISYIAPASGTDTLSYTVTDQAGDSITGTSTITIDPGPILTAGSIGLAHGTTVNFLAKISSLITPGLTGDKDTVISAIAQTGTIVYGANGAISYTAPASGRDVVTFTVQDQRGDVATSTETITVDYASVSGTIGHYGSAGDPSTGSADAGVTVTLINAAGVAVASTVTNSAGYYALVYVLPGTYRLLYTPPPGQAIMSTTKVIDPTTGLSAPFTLVANQSYSAARVPLVAGAVFTGKVLNAAGGEGGVSVALLNSSGATVATTTTASDGSFSFNSLVAGSYQIDYIAPPGQYLLSGSAAPATGLTPSYSVVAGQTLTLTNEVLAVITSTLSGSVVYAGAPEANVPVALLNSTGSVVATGTTDAKGQFSFSGLAAGSYQLDYTPLAGQMPQAGGAADPVTGETGTIVLAQGQTLTLTPETMVAIPLGGFTGKVLNAAGGEANVSVVLLNSSGAKLATAVTASDGSFSFTGLVAGSYQLDYIAPAGQYLASGNANAATGLTPSFTLGAGQTLALANEVLAVITSTLSGSVVYAGAPDAGVSVALLNSTGSVVATGTTDSNGQFSFSGLSAGSYQLDYKPLSGQMPQSGGAADPVTGETGTIVLTQGQTLTLTPETMVPIPLAGFTGKVLNAAGGEANVTVTLLSSTGATLATTVTGTNGSFAFSGLAAGAYRLCYTAPPGQYLVSGNANSTTGLTPAFTLKAGQVVAVANEVLGVITSSLSGSVVYAGAPDVGVPVALLNSTGSVVATGTTDTNGQFSFSGLAAGNYQLAYTPLAGQMPQSGGIADQVSGQTGTIALAQGQTLTLAAETMVPVTVTVSGTVLEDGAPESGVTVRLLDGSGNVLSKLTTDSNGKYSFAGLSAGTYGVAVVAPSGQVLQTGGAANPATGIIPAVAVAAGQTAVMATETLLANPGRVDGSIHHYGSADPVYGTGQYGVVVSLLDATGKVIATTTVAAASGWFSFGQLAAGSYQIQYTPPADEAVRAATGLNNAAGLSTSFTVAAGQDLWLPTYGVTSISNTFDFSGTGAVALRGDGNYVVTGSAINGTLVLGAGNQSVVLTGKGDSVTTGAGTQSITLAGTGNKVTVGLGTATLNVGTGSATVHAAGGLVTITAGGANNLFDAGAGTNFLNADGSAGNVFMLNGGQQGVTTITGFNLSTTDTLDLARTLAGVNILPDLSNVGSYITTSVSNGNTTLYTNVDAGGHTIANTSIAVLAGVSTSVNALINGHHISIA